MALEQQVIGPWVIEIDRDATATIYAQIPDGAEDCGCDHCQHWSANRESVYPAAVREFLAELGIDYRREAEVFQLDPRPETHLCAGWFHFVGRTVSGPQDKLEVIKGAVLGTPPDPSPIDGGFGVALSNGPLGFLAPAKEAFDAASAHGLPVAQLDFQTSSHKIEVELGGSLRVQIPPDEPPGG